MKESMINIRMNSTLKQHGMNVLAKENISVTEAVHRLFDYLEKNQTLPPDLRSSSESGEDLYRHKREIMSAMIGILPDEPTLYNIKEARLSARGL